MSAATVLVTGAAGFVGSHVAAALLDAGWRVRGVDNFDPAYARAHKDAALAPLRARFGFHFVRGDITRPAVRRTVLDRVRVVVHCAGRGGVRASVTAPAAQARANVWSTAALLAACRDARVQRFVLLSSSSVYGAAPLPFHEDQAWLRPASPYGASKRAGELLAHAAARGGMRVLVLRLFSVFGPGQRPDQVVWRFAARLAAGKAAEQYGDGSAVRDFTYVGDVARAVALGVGWVLEQPVAGGGVTVNIGRGHPVRVAEVRARLAACLGRADAVRARPPAAGDVPATRAATGRARDLLGWEATTPLDEGLAAFAQWFEVMHERATGTTARPGA